ncbi:MAG: hypothetical protein HND56_01845 [Pseudomonadota bacterium]|nr:MAG: hypothetical protein HND56_01845 [Pseudomonadota bacterium]
MTARVILYTAILLICLILGSFFHYVWSEREDLFKKEFDPQRVIEEEILKNDPVAIKEWRKMQREDAALKQKQKDFILSIGGENLPRSVLIADFLNVAFSSKLWNEDTGQDYEMFLRTKETQPLSSILEKRYPWLRLLYRNDNLPKPYALTKWDQKITIGLDWPMGAFSHGRAVEEKFPGTYKMFEKQIKDIIPDIQRLTGLDVEFIAKNDPREKTEEFARIRVIPIIRTHLRNYFRFHRENMYGRGGASYSWHIDEHEYHFWGAVQFTPLSRTQVYGYLVPQENNTLSMSVCRIIPAVGEKLAKALITECLLRSLGLPELSKQKPKDTLGEWNLSHTPDSLLPALDGNEKAFLARGPFYGIDERTVHPFRSELTDEDVLPKGFSAYDQAMVSLLYCPELRSGMDKHQVLAVLLSDRSRCFR